MIASEPAVKRAINILYGNEGAAEAMAQMQAETAAAQEVRQGQTAAREGQENVTPMIRLVNSIIERAISENASDIHFEPTEEEMVVRMRIDGQLHRIMTIPSELKDSVISRLKIMSQLDIVEKMNSAGWSCGDAFKRKMILICVYPPFRPCMEKKWLSVF